MQAQRTGAVWYRRNVSRGCQLSREVSAWFSPTAVLDASNNPRSEYALLQTSKTPKTMAINTAHSNIAKRVPRLPTDEEYAAMGTGGEKGKSLLMAMVRGEVGFTSANSAEFMADILRDSATVGSPPPATQQAQQQAKPKASGEPVAASVKPPALPHAHRGATDYGKWDTFVDDDSD